MALLGLTVIVGVPATLGRVDALFTLLAILWLAITAFAVPIVMREQRDGHRVALSGMLVALRRSLAMSQTAFFHAIVVVLLLYVVTVLITSLLASSLGNFGDQSELAAFVISRAVLVPIVFIGLAVLYLDQRARMLGVAEEPHGASVSEQTQISRSRARDSGAAAGVGARRDRIVASGRVWRAAHKTPAA